jgi:hypothetical protein
MRLPLSRLSLLLGVLVFAAALMQKSIANWVGHPMTEPTAIEKVIDGVKGATGARPMVEIPTHPVAAVIFWAGLGVAGLALFAWIVEDCFWLPLVAACLGIAAAILKLAWVPALLGMLKAAQTANQRRTGRTRRATSPSASSSRRRRL